jgi:hypothetical protein
MFMMVAQTLSVQDGPGTLNPEHSIIGKYTYAWAVNVSTPAVNVPRIPTWTGLCRSRLL